MFKPVQNPAYTALATHYKTLLSFIDQAGFYVSPTAEQIQTLRLFLESALICVNEYKTGKGRKHDFLMSLYHFAESTYQELAKGGVPASELNSIVHERPKKDFMTASIKGLYLHITNPALIPANSAIKAAARDGVNHFKTVTEKLRRALGNQLFSKYPTLAFEAINGNCEEGSMLVLKGYKIPKTGTAWFAKKLIGICRFDFIATGDNTVQLRILDILNNSTERFAEQLRSKGGSESLVAGKAFTTIYTAAITKGQFRPHDVIFTEGMKEECERRINMKFIELIAFGVNTNNLSTDEICRIFLPLQDALISEFLHKAKDVGVKI